MFGSFPKPFSVLKFNQHKMCRQLVSPVSPVGVASWQLATLATLFWDTIFGKKFKSPLKKNLNSSRISIVGMPSHQVVYLTRSEVENIRMFFWLTYFGQNASFFMNFNIFSSKFRKIKISRDSGGVRSSALDMFYIKDSTFDFLRFFFDFFFVEKNPKKILKNQMYYPWCKTYPKQSF